MATEQQLISVLRSFLGTREEPDPPATSNRTWIGREFGWDGVPWCMETVWVAHNRLGLASYPKTAAVGAYLNYGKQGVGGLTFSMTPSVGAQQIIDRGGRGNWADFHIGTVEELRGNQNLCIDGNWGGGVTRVLRSTTYQTLGYVRAAFSSPPASSAPDIAWVFSPFINNRHPYVKTIQQIVGAKIDGAYGGETATKVAAFQEKLGIRPGYGVWDVPTQAASNALFAYLAGLNKPPAVNWDAIAAIVAATKTTLKFGARGDNVAILQKLLTTKGFPTAADGAFGNGTLAQVRRFQQSRGLFVDGIVGPSTWRALTT